MSCKELNKSLFDTLVKSFHIIFEAQDPHTDNWQDILKVASAYEDFDVEFKLYVITSQTHAHYAKKVQKQIIKRGLQKRVFFKRELSQIDLRTYYKSANLFLSFSQGKDYKAPLQRALCSSLPVVAFKTSVVTNILQGGGSLFLKKAPLEVAAFINLLRKNPSLRYAVLQTQEKAATTHCPEKKIRYNFEGPFDSSYSLAQLNKNAALSFEERFPSKVALYPLEGTGDIAPDENFLRKNKRVHTLYKHARKAADVEVTFRNCFPPNVQGMRSKLNILNSFGWEESGFDYEYIKKFNGNLNGIIAVSKYVKKVLVANGATVPVQVISNPVDKILAVAPKPLGLQTDKSFKFLHISSCFPRKGVDVLLNAYFQTFCGDDDVVLIIKTFPNPHNDVEKLLQKLQQNRTNAPQVEFINHDIEEPSLVWLYQNSDCLVAPSRGEGFGLPLAEAMLFDLPVITTAYGGQNDFCDDDTAWTVDYSFAKAKTHLRLFDSFWVEPDLDSLKERLSEQISLSKEQKRKKTDVAKKRVSGFTWERYVDEALGFIHTLKTREPFIKNPMRLSVISSFNTKCGIASYCQSLLNEFTPHVKEGLKIYANKTRYPLDETKENRLNRCWNDRFDVNIDALINAIKEDKPTHVLINFNFAFFSMQNFQLLLQTLDMQKVKTTIIFHSVQDVTIEGLQSSLGWIQNVLQNVQNILVHNIDDLNVLKGFNLVDNVMLFPHGVQTKFQKAQPTQKKEFVVASFGFMLPHKGIHELIEAFYTVKQKCSDVKLLLLNALYDDKVSQAYLQRCKKTIRNLNLQSDTLMINDYLKDEEIYAYLQKADLIVLPYKNTQESSSASVRFALGANKPVLVTPASIFNDVEEVVEFCDSRNPQDIARAILEMINHPTMLNQKDTIRTKWLQTHDWKVVAQKLQNILEYS